VTHDSQWDALRAKVARLLLKLQVLWCNGVMETKSEPLLALCLHGSEMMNLCDANEDNNKHAVTVTNYSKLYAPSRYPVVLPGGEGVDYSVCQSQANYLLQLLDPV
jgi:hypothetical protein